MVCVILQMKREIGLYLINDDVNAPWIIQVMRIWLWLWLQTGGQMTITAAQIQINRLNLGRLLFFFLFFSFFKCDKRFPILLSRRRTLSAVTRSVKRLGNALQITNRGKFATVTHREVGRREGWLRGKSGHTHRVTGFCQVWDDHCARIGGNCGAQISSKSFLFKKNNGE